MQLLYNRMSIDTWEICSSQLTKALPRRLGHQHPPRWPCDRRGELPHRGAAPHVPPCPPPRWLHLVYDALQSCESRRRTTLHQKWVSRKNLNWDKFGTILNWHIQIYYQFHELELFTVINSNIIISVVKPNHLSLSLIWINCKLCCLQLQTLIRHATNSRLFSCLPNLVQCTMKKIAALIQKFLVTHDTSRPKVSLLKEKN